MVTFKNYLSLIKFSHTIFAMPFALIGFFLGLLRYKGRSNGEARAEEGCIGCYNYNVSGDSLIVKLQTGSNRIGTISIYILLVILCMIFARSAAMAFNRYLDRHFDAKNARTAVREIPSGVLKANNVLFFTIVNCVLFIVCTYFINRICFYLSPIALAVVLGYSYTKRFTPLCHLILGLGLSLAPIGAYLAVTGQFAVLPILFSLAVIFWVSGFDVIYALQDEEFDKSAKLYSIPAAVGKQKALNISVLLHVLSTLAVISAGLYGEFDWVYWLGAAVFMGMLLYQHAVVKPNDLRRVNLAFMTANGIASVVFAVLVILDLFVNKS